MRGNTHETRDESHPLTLPNHTLRALVGGAAVYAIYRMVQTALLVPATTNRVVGIPVRLIVSAADGGIMALLAPVALTMTRRFPIAPPNRVKNACIHGAVALIASVGWIFILRGVFNWATRQPFAGAFANVSLSWLTSNLFAYALFVAVLHALSFQERLREQELHAARLESRLSTARLETLKAQLHPHFLFNTLHTISELIHIDPDVADAMVIRLGRLLRLSLDFTADDETPLRRELEVLSTYLDIHRVRHEDRLIAEFDIDAAAGEALVPPLILQPLVENALRHGIGSRSPGRIWIGAHVEASYLRLTVEDDGVGLSPGASEGVGLKNTRRRLVELYGEDQAFNVGSRDHGGVTATIRVPLRTSAIPSARSAE